MDNTVVNTVPAGPRLHEIKYDGYRYVRSRSEQTSSGLVEMTARDPQCGDIDAIAKDVTRWLIEIGVISGNSLFDHLPLVFVSTLLSYNVS